jgi:hypothetical protein
MRIGIALIASVALAFAAERAQACQGTHFAVTNTGSSDAGCIFNVTVGMDATYSGIVNGSGGDQVSADYIAGALVGQGDGGSVNLTNAESQYATGEGNIQFTVPAGVGEVTITVTSTDGAQASATDVLVNGVFQPGNPGGGGCSPPPPPPPPLNTAIPGPGMSMQDNESAVNTQQSANVPLADSQGQNQGNMKGVHE